MERIDLHIHTSASDGTLTPGEVVSLASSMGLRAIAITDHDSVGGIVASRGLTEVIPGIELSAEYEGKEIHILGYFIDPTSAELNGALEDAVISRNRRNESIVLRMAEDGYMLSMDEIRNRYPNSVIGRPHIAAELVEKGYVQTIRDAFSKFLGERRPYFLPREYFPFDTAVKLIRSAGGISVLAHPMQYGYSESGLLRLIVRAKEAGVSGLEAYHPLSLPGDRNKVVEMAGRFKMLITGGSDFHGENKEGADIGSVSVPAQILHSLKAAAEGKAGA